MLERLAEVALELDALSHRSLDGVAGISASKIRRATESAYFAIDLANRLPRNRVQRLRRAEEAIFTCQWLFRVLYVRRQINPLLYAEVRWRMDAIANALAAILPVPGGPRCDGAASS